MAMSMGVIRSVDELGRIVIPKEVRKILEIDTGTQVEILADFHSKEILLRKFNREPDYKSMWEEAISRGAISPHMTELLEAKHSKER